MSLMALPAVLMAFSVSWLMFAASILYICCSTWAIWSLVCWRLRSCTFFRRRAALAARWVEIVLALSLHFMFEEGRDCNLHTGVPLPVLFVAKFFLAIASWSVIWLSRCLSRFCNISNCCRSIRIAFLGPSFFRALAPPNQPHISVHSRGWWEVSESTRGGRSATIKRAYRGPLNPAGENGFVPAEWCGNGWIPKTECCCLRVTRLNAGAWVVILFVGSKSFQASCSERWKLTARMSIWCRLIVIDEIRW